MFDEMISLSEAAKLLPRNPSGHCVHRHTIYRWIAKGVKRHGRMVRLKAKHIGNRIFTCEEWIKEFVAGCSGEKDPDESPPPRNIVSQREAERFLIAEGVYGREAQKALLGEKRYREVRRQERRR